MEFLGYTVETVDRGIIAYYLSKQGEKKFALVRNKRFPALLFVIHTSRMVGDAKIEGYSWFTDKGGVLKPIK